MVDLREGYFFGHAVAAQSHFHCTVEFETRIKFDIAFRPHNAVIINRCRPKAADELCQPTGWKAQRRGQTGLYLEKARVIGGDRSDETTTGIT